MSRMADHWDVVDETEGNPPSCTCGEPNSPGVHGAHGRPCYQREGGSDGGGALVARSYAVQVPPTPLPDVFGCLGWGGDDDDK